MPTATPCALVIFGASGDLAKLKLIPAIYELAHEKLLPEKFALIGYGRKDISDDEFRKICNEAIQKNSRGSLRPLKLSLWPLPASETWGYGTSSLTFISLVFSKASGKAERNAVPLIRVRAARRKERGTDELLRLTATNGLTLVPATFRQSLL